MIGASDEEQLTAAVNEGCALVSRNKNDFIRQGKQGFFIINRLICYPLSLGCVVLRIVANSCALCFIDFLNADK